MHRPVPLPSSPHRCDCIFRRGPAWAGSLSICTCCLQNHRRLVQTQPSPGPTPARGSSKCPAALYTAWENCCPTDMEAKVLLDFCRIQRKCKSELHVWAACLERCLCPRSCKRSSARWSSSSWETARRAHPSDTCSCAPVLCAHALPRAAPPPLTCSLDTPPSGCLLTCRDVTFHCALALQAQDLRGRPCSRIVPVFRDQPRAHWVSGAGH